MHVWRNVLVSALMVITYTHILYVCVYLWLMPLMTLVGDQSGSCAVNTTLSRNKLGFWSSGYADVSL